MDVHLVTVLEGNITVKIVIFLKRLFWNFTELLEGMYYTTHALNKKKEPWQESD